MIDFVNGNLTRTYLHPSPGATTLPAPRSWIRQMEDFLEDCGEPRGDDPPASGLSKTISPAEGGRLFGVSSRTFVRWVNNGKIQAKRLSSKAYQVAVDDLPTPKRR